MGSPKVAVWTNSSRTGDGVSLGSAKLVVVGRMHDEKDEESGIEW